MPDLVVARFGARGSGKSHDAKTYLRSLRQPRALIWDTMDEYGDVAERVDSLVAMNARTAGATFSVRYIPRGTPRELAVRFAAFCELAYTRGRLVMVVEELQTVTEPSRAPAAWADCTLRGRHVGLSIWGLSQRPASVDKDFFSNATHVCTGRLNYVDDVRCMAGVLGVAPEAITALRGEPHYDWIKRDMVRGSLTSSPPSLLAMRKLIAGAPPAFTQKKVVSRRRR